MSRGGQRTFRYFGETKPLDYRSVCHVSITCVSAPLPPSVLAEDAIKAAVKDYKLKQEKTTEPVAASATN